MSINNDATPPLAAVHSVVDTTPREGSGSGLPRPAHLPDAPAAPGPTTETESAGPKHVQLPDFPNYELSFRLDKERGRVVIHVIDSKTGEIVRTVPPEDLSRALRQLPDGRGVLLDREG